MDNLNQQSVQITGGGVRRAPMNQDEFDMKFNFSEQQKGHQSQRRFSFESIVQQSNNHFTGPFLCWPCQCSATLQPMQQQTRNRHISLNGQAPPSLHYNLSDAEEKLGEGMTRQPKSRLGRYFPLVNRLQRYSFRKDCIGDLYAGIMLALQSVAEAMAMAFLAGLPPVFGLHTTLIAALLYTVFGTSTHSFLGTNAVICMLLRNVLERTTIPYNFYAISESNGEVIDEITANVATVTFLCALIQSLIYVFRLDFIFSLFPDHLLAGFSLGSGIRILFVALQYVVPLRGKCVVELPQRSASGMVEPMGEKQEFLSLGFAKCLFWATYSLIGGTKDDSVTTDMATNITVHFCLSSFQECVSAINVSATFTISIICLVFLVVARQILSPLVRFQLNSSIPFDFVLIALASLLSHFLFEAGLGWQVETIGHIDGRWIFALPQLSKFDDLFVDALAFAILGYTMHIKLINEMDRTKKAEVKQRQELLALAIVGFISVFFGAHPSGQSKGRNRLGVETGVRTILVNVPIVLVVLPVILWSTILFETLPVCTLACILLMGLSNVFSDCPFNLVTLWHASKLDVVTFVFAMLSALFSTNLSHALFLSALFSAGTVIWRASCPMVQMLVNVTGSGAYYAEKSFYGYELSEDNGVGIIRFEAPLLFNNAGHFKACALTVVKQIKGQLLGLDNRTRTGSMKSMRSTNAAVIAGSTNPKDLQMRSTLLISGDVVPNYDIGPGTGSDQTPNKVLIIDFSSVPYVDTQGLLLMRELFEELWELKTRLLFASVNSTIRTIFKSIGGFDSVPKHYFFPSIHDAVLCAQQLGGGIPPSIHMSVSLNGCRDLITLSNAASNHDLLTMDTAATFSEPRGSNSQRPSTIIATAVVHNTGSQTEVQRRSSPTLTSVSSSTRLSLKKSNS